MVTGENVNFAELIWEDFKFQINSKKSSKQKKELLPFSKFTKIICLKKRHSKTVFKESAQSEGVENDADSEETEEEDEIPLVQRQTGIVISEGSGETPIVTDEPSGSLSSSSSESDDEIKDIFSDEDDKAAKEKDVDEQAVDDQLMDEQAEKVQVEESIAEPQV
ncbi:hypothetical protein Tco_1250376, partial [Tanacetum coccineum]